MSHRSGCTFQYPSASTNLTTTTLITHWARSSVLGQLKWKLLSAYLFKSTIAAETPQYAIPARSEEEPFLPSSSEPLLAADWASALEVGSKFMTGKPPGPARAALGACLARSHDTVALLSSTSTTTTMCAP